MPDHEVGKKGPVLSEHQLHQSRFDLNRIVQPGETHAAGETAHVGVDDDSLGQIEGVAQNHIGGFTADSRKFVEMFHRLRNLAPVILDQGSGTAANRFGFGAVKAGGAYDRFKFSRGNFRKIPGCFASLEKGRGHLVDPRIGALGGKNGRDEELQWVGVV